MNKETQNIEFYFGKEYADTIQKTIRKRELVRE